MDESIYPFSWMSVSKLALDDKIQSQYNTARIWEMCSQSSVHHLDGAMHSSKCTYRMISIQAIPDPFEDALMLARTPSEKSAHNARHHSSPCQALTPYE